jgi:hypothetical protein
LAFSDPAVFGNGTTGGAASSDGSVMATTGVAQVRIMGNFGSSSFGTGYSSSGSPDSTTTSGDTAAKSYGATAGALQTSTSTETTSFEIDVEAAGGGDFEATSGLDAGSTGAGNGSLVVTTLGEGDDIDNGSSTASAEASGGGRGDESEVTLSDSKTIQGFNNAGRASFSDRASTRPNRKFGNRAGVDRFKRPTRASRISDAP